MDPVKAIKELIRPHSNNRGITEDEVWKTFKKINKKLTDKDYTKDRIIKLCGNVCGKHTVKSSTTRKDAFALLMHNLKGHMRVRNAYIKKGGGPSIGYSRPGVVGHPTGVVGYPSRPGVVGYPTGVVGHQGYTLGYTHTGVTTRPSQTRSNAQQFTMVGTPMPLLDRHVQGIVKSATQNNPLVTSKGSEIDQLTNITFQNGITMYDCSNVPEKLQCMFVTDADMTEASIEGNAQTYSSLSYIFNNMTIFILNKSTNIIDVFNNKELDVKNKVIYAHILCQCALSYVIEDLKVTFYVKSDEDIHQQVTQQSLDIFFANVTSPATTGGRRPRNDKIRPKKGGFDLKQVFSLERIAQSFSRCFGVSSSNQIVPEPLTPTVIIIGTDGIHQLQPEIQLNPLNMIMQRNEPLCLYVAALTVLSTSDGFRQVLETTYKTLDKDATRKVLLEKLLSFANTTNTIIQAYNAMVTLETQQTEQTEQMYQGLATYANTLKGFVTSEYIDLLHEYAPKIFPPANKLQTHMSGLYTFVINFMKHIVGYNGPIVKLFISTDFKEILMSPQDLTFVQTQNKDPLLYFSFLDSYLMRASFPEVTRPNPNVRMVTSNKDDIFKASIAITKPSIEKPTIKHYETVGFIIGNIDNNDSGVGHAISGFRNDRTEFVYNGHRVDHNKIEALPCKPYQVLWSSLVNTSYFIPRVAGGADECEAKFNIPIGDVKKYYEYKLVPGSQFFGIGVISDKPISENTKANARPSNLEKLDIIAVITNLVPSVTKEDLSQFSSDFLQETAYAAIKDKLMTSVYIGKGVAFLPNVTILPQQSVKSVQQYVYTGDFIPLSLSQDENINASELIRSMLRDNEYIMINDPKAFVMFDKQLTRMFANSIVEKTNITKPNKHLMYVQDTITSTVDAVYSQLNVHQTQDIITTIKTTIKYINGPNVTKWLSNITKNLRNIAHYKYKTSFANLKKIQLVERGTTIKPDYVDELAKYILLVCTKHICDSMMLPTITTTNDALNKIKETCMLHILPRLNQVFTLLQLAGIGKKITVEPDVINDDITFPHETIDKKRKVLANLLNLSVQDYKYTYNQEDYKDHDISAIVIRNIMIRYYHCKVQLEANIKWAIPGNDDSNKCDVTQTGSGKKKTKQVKQSKYTKKT